MATAEEFVCGDDLDAIFDVIDDDIFEQDEEFANLISSNVSEVSLFCICFYFRSFCGSEQCDRKKS